MKHISDKSKAKISTVATSDHDVVVERDSNFISVYSNHAQCGFTGFDIFVFLGEAAQGPDGKIEVVQKVRVSMSPMQAVLLATFLQSSVKRYEEHTGHKVVIPKSVYTLSGDIQANAEHFEG